MMHSIPHGVQVGAGTTASINGTKNYAFVGRTIGGSLGEIKKIKDYFLPFSVGLDFDIRKVGSNPYITPGFSQGCSGSIFIGGSDNGVVFSTDVGVSYDMNYYWMRDKN